ncbi:MAG: hypothetical protein K2P84_05280 [Undibacterium sp.]|nr:hypothetical protein [Undibacterium sp.]
MKTSIQNKAILAFASIAALVAVASAFQAPAHATSTVNLAEQNVQTVNIVAKHMTAEQKLNFDLQSQQEQATQTVLISAKRLSAEQKLAFDQQDTAWKTAARTKTAPNQG